MYVVFNPIIRRPAERYLPHWLHRPMARGEEGLIIDLPRYRHVGVALANDQDDRMVLNHAVGLAKLHGAEMTLFHIVEGAGGQVYGTSARDQEAREDEEYLRHVVEALVPHQIRADFCLGYGPVAKELIRIVGEKKVDVLVMAGHGHRGISDILFGSTIAPVRHELEIPVIIVR
jgi:manganese transport protein